MNRGEFQRLAEVRVREAEALLAAGLWDGAYYLAGYAVECELKAAIIARVGREPELLFADKEKEFQKRSWTHDLKALVALAGLQPQLDTRLKADPEFESRWVSLTGKWNEAARYKFWTEVDASDLLDAVNNPFFGVWPWLVSLR